MKKRTSPPPPLPRLTNDQLAQLLAAEERAKQDPGIDRPGCFICQSVVVGWAADVGDEHEDERVVTVQPCGHQATYSVKVAEVLAGQARAATEATELDKTRRYLRPVRATPLSDAPAGVHLAVYSWLEKADAWATGPGICGESTEQGALPEDAVVTCAGCLDRQEDYERYLAPGYQPGDDDPKALRARAEAAECEVKQARALVAKWQQIAAQREGATIRVDVAAGILKATLDGFNDLLAEVDG